ncbi:MAG: hypothetical protein H5U18_08690 [Rhodobacteraceae bacterium]|nr:hypothetical protein [Paracoccaceae bacterium]
MAADVQAEISAAPGVSTKTMQNTLYQVKSQLDARTDAQLVWIAIEACLLAAPSSDRS